MSGWAIIGIACGLAVGGLVAAAIYAAVKKIDIGTALKVYALGVASAALLAAGVVVALLVRRKDETVNPSGAPTDSGAAAIGATLDAARDRIRTRIKAALHKAAGS